MWQPSLTSLRNIEEDDAGRLKAFREKFGRGWDAESKEEEDVEEEESLMDLISGTKGEKKAVREEKVGEMVTVRRNGILVEVPAGGKDGRRK